MPSLVPRRVSYLAARATSRRPQIARRALTDHVLWQHADMAQIDQPFDTLRSDLKWPDAQAIGDFWRDGWYVSPVILSDRDIATLVRASADYYRGERDRCLPRIPPSAAYWRPEHGNGFRMNDYVNYEKREFDALARHPVIAGIAARLLMTPLLRVFGTSLIYKPADPTCGRVGWHTDKAYWQTCTSFQMITAWVPLHDCDEHNGSLAVISGSHWWNHPDSIGPPNNPDFDRLRARYGQSPGSLAPARDSEEHFMRLDPDQLERRLQRLARGRPIEKRILRLKKGQVSFHHGSTYHGSECNRSPRPRVACSLHYQCGDNRYRPHVLPSGKQLIYNTDHLCRRRDGQPDYTDPEYFPVVYRDSQPPT